MPEIMLILIRSIAAFFVLLVMARMMGKKQVSQLTFFDYCVGITIGSIAAMISVDQNVKILNGLVALLIWGFFPIAFSYFGLKSLTFSRIIDGRPVVLISEGKIQEKVLEKNLLNASELLMLLREKGVYNVADVEMAVFEVNGELSVLLKADQKPATPRVLGIKVEREHTSAVLIMDGKLHDKNMKSMDLTREWVEQEVKKHGAQRIEDVYLAQLDSRGDLFVELKAGQSGDN